MEDRYEFDDVTLFSAYAVGVPGKRTFFLAIGEKDKWARVWLEKEHLEVIGPAIDQLFLALTERDIPVPAKSKATTAEDGNPEGFPFIELEVEQISLGYEDGQALFNILTRGMGPQSENQADVDCRTTLEKFQKLGNQTRALCAAGRPRCKICGQPIDPEGHVCPEQN